MSITLKVNHEQRSIVMSRNFAKLAEDTLSAEYAHLQRVRLDYSDYRVVVRCIKTNPNKETYKGLTYAYMENYISSHDNSEENMNEYKELRLISECHAQCKRYPVIKKWFLETYPEVAEYGIDIDIAESGDTEYEDECA